VLVTGFGAFRNHSENPSSILASQLSVDNVTLKVTYPLVESFAKQLGSTDHNRVLCLGLSAAATELKFELYSHNRIGSEKGSSGRQHKRTVIRPSGPMTLGQTLATPSQLPDLPMNVSYTPGDYLCNFLLYSLLVRYPERRIGFVHVPLFEKVSEAEQLMQLKNLCEHLELS
jgi:pyrrolidone-carboxylate peptidase